MHAIHRGATTLEERRHMKGGIEGPKALLQGLRFQHPMAPQRRITTADQQQIRTTQAFRLKGLIEVGGDLLITDLRVRRREGAGVSQQKQQRGRMPQGSLEGARIPAQQQRTTMHRLRPGGVVIDYDNLHGTIVA